MAPKSKKPPQCQVCLEHDFKYTCPQCRIVYCSLGCYKQHKDSNCAKPAVENAALSDKPENTFKEPIDLGTIISHATGTASEDIPQEESMSLRPLSSLKWPYVPDESAFPDPLKRDDPKILQLSQYEAIATSPAIRKILSEHKNLPELLTSIDKLRGPEREQALQNALGVKAPEINDQLHPAQLSEDVLALRELAEAIEAAVRGDNTSALGLNWEG